jgi:DNA-binding NarL/FixJ family response regulator
VHGTEMYMRTVVIIEDHELMRSALTALLEKEWKVAGTAGTLEEARTLFKNMTEKPDIVILDIELGKEWGLDIIGDKTFGKGNFPPVLVYTVYNDFAHVNAAIRTGAKGYVCKSQSSAELLEAMEDVLSGKISFPPEMLQRHAITTDKIIGLSKKEHKIFTMVQKRKTNKQIAAALGVTVRTIENNLSIIYDKTGVKNRKELEKL